MTGWDWFWATAAVFDVALIFGVLLLWALERAHRRLWERRARRARGEVIDLTGMQPRFGNQPAGRTPVSVPVHKPELDDYSGFDRGGGAS